MELCEEMLSLVNFITIRKGFWHIWEESLLLFMVFLPGKPKDLWTLCQGGWPWSRGNMNRGSGWDGSSVSLSGIRTLYLSKTIPLYLQSSLVPSPRDCLCTSSWLRLALAQPCLSSPSAPLLLPIACKALEKQWLRVWDAATDGQARKGQQVPFSPTFLILWGAEKKSVWL